ncbi:MAG: SHOCT domain-containing protein [Actinomycetota bacterium]
MLLADHIGRGGGGPGFLFPLLFLLLIGFLVATVIRRRRGIGRFAGYGSPLATLQERFARGEIDRAEFEHRKAVLSGDDNVPPAPHRAAPPSPSAPGPEPSGGDVDSPSEEA